ncbi:MAG: cell envelope integrity protein TolA [Gammaproteobacteria bacterium]|nr:cell envelope integrity protein TolA [Gammaproteobacteria bacterium]
MSKRLIISLVISLLAHLLLLLGMILAYSFDSVAVPRDKVAPNIRAVAVDGAAIKQRKEVKKTPQKTPPKAQDDKAKLRKQQEERKRQQQIAEEKKRKAAEAKKQADAKKKQAEEVKRQKELAEQKKRDEAERKKREQALAEQRQREEELLAEQMAAEQQAMAAEREAVLSEVEIYKTRIEARIRQYWNQPEFQGECTFNIRLGPGGILLSYQELAEKGNRYCDSAERAVAKAAPFPMSKNPAVIDELRSLNILLRPKQDIN